MAPQHLNLKTMTFANQIFNANWKPLTATPCTPIARVFGILFFFCLMTFSVQAQIINGYQVNSVTYTGSETGSFERTGPNTWAEYKTNNRNVHGTFTETNRDEWSVYLSKSDGARIQIDLHRKQIFYNGQFLYNVGVPSRNLLAPKPTGAGWSTYAAISPDGKQLITLKQTGQKIWQETSKLETTQATRVAAGRNMAVTRRLQEIARDQWSVYLTDGTERLQIDLHRRELIYPNRRVAITEFEDKMNGWNMSGVIFGHSEHQRLGQFMQVAPGVWKELGDSGSWFNFRETHRDEWSTYLHDASRNVYIQIDLHRKMIRYRAGNESFRDLYRVLEAI